MLPSYIEQYTIFYDKHEFIDSTYIPDSVKVNHVTSKLVEKLF